MRATHSRLRLGVVAILALTLASLIGAGAQSPTAAADSPGGPYTNPGFELGDEGWFFDGPDAATVVSGSEGLAQYAAYDNTPDGDITVTPNMGGNMLRLGTPKSVASSQPNGINVATQNFVPTSSTMTFAARLFSWENRRETDYIELSFKKADGTAAGTFTPFSFTKKGATSATVSCAGASICRQAIDVGNRGDYLSSLGSSDTGWVVITVTGLPTDQNVTFTASVGSTANNALASWLYLDSANTPPVADFDEAFATVSMSGGTAGANPIGPLEGSPIQFRDLSTDPDGPDDIVAWEWTISGIDGKLNVQNPFFIPHNNGTYSITLKVTDAGGLSDTETRSITVENAPPLVNALNVETLASRPYPVVGRFTDAGWEDTHSANWTGAANVTGPSLIEDHAPAIGTGKVTGTGNAAVSTSGVLTVSDGTESRSDPYTVTVLPNTSSLLNHTEFGTARTVEVDGSYLGLLPTERTRSVFEIQWPGTDGNGEPLPGGSEILVNLKDLPADYDLVLVTTDGQQSAGYAFSGYAFSGFAFSGYAFSDLPQLVSPHTAGYAFSGSQAAGYAFSGIQRAAYGEAGYAFSELDTAGYAFSGYAFSGYAFSGYAFSDAGGFESNAFAPYAVAGYAFSPISQMSYTGLQSTNTSPSDVSLSELGLGAIPAGTSIVGYSANRGLGGETVLARIDTPGTKLYAIVVGANGVHSSEPFRLDVEGSMTITAAALNAADGAPGKEVLTGATCAPRTVPSLAASPSLATTAPSSPKTLFVTNEKRLAGLHQAESTTWPAFVGSVQSLAARSDVAGKIISVETPGYAAWDAAPCSIEAANAVSDEVRTAIQQQLLSNPSIEYVVILGDDDVIPFRRVPDQVSIGNERSYLSSSFLKQGTPLYASVAGGYNLTDDCNVDANPTPWQGRELCIPDKVISRLVETPSEIAAQAEAFKNAQGLLDAATEKTGFVAGYDFFSDGSVAVKNALAVFLNPVGELINESWTATQLRCSLLGIGTGCTAVPASVSDANAHFTHYAGLSAGGFNTGVYDDVLTSDDVKTAGVLKLAGKLVYTIGCHAGFSAPDRAFGTIDPELGVNPKLDFPQAFAQANAVYIASTGYGIGDDSGIAGTERLIVLYAEELAKGKTAGQALRDAKRYYLASLPAASVYDEKSSINLVLYGLPMYNLGIQGAAQPLSAATEAQASTQTGSPATFPVALNTIAGKGSYYSVVGGDAAAPPYRPLQPRAVVEVPAGDPVHGILWKSGGFTDTPNFDPVIARPSIEWEENPSEPQVCYQGFWPSEVFRVNTLDNADGDLEQTIVVTPGQFRCDTPNAATVTGTQRLFNILGWEMLRSTSEDVTPPSLTGLDIELSTDPAKPLTLEIIALDPEVAGGAVETTGVARFVILRINPATGLVTTIADDSAFDAAAQVTRSIDIPNVGNDRLVIQIIDGAGNVGFYTAKGPGLRILNVDLGPDKTFTAGQPVSFTAAVNEGGEPMVGPVTYFWEFGDGNTATTVNTNTVTHTFTGGLSEYTVKVKVSDSNGGIGVDTVKVRQYCFDPAGDVVFQPGATVNAGQADLVGCSVSHNATKMTITLQTATTLKLGSALYPEKIRFTVNLKVGNGSAKNISYREGSWTGLKSLEVAVSGNTISFTFDQKDIGWTPQKTLSWYAETQGGVEGTSGAGSLDRMKDVGTFTYPQTP